MRAARQSVERLDQLLERRGLFPSREKARRAVMAGLVEVDGRRIDKPGRAVSPEAEVRVAGPAEPYVSRGGRKLEAALEHFSIRPEGWICADIGASTGGFTDCLLARGARKVFAVDAGYGQLDYRLRRHPRVVVMERTNARYLPADALVDACDLATFDVSFISVTKVIPAVVPHVRPGGLVLTLIKPQFEAGRTEVGKGGVIRDASVRSLAISKTVSAIVGLGALEHLGSVDSVVAGAKGNLEAFALFRKRAAA